MSMTFTHSTQIALSYHDAHPSAQSLLDKWRTTTAIHQQAMAVLIEQLPKCAKLVEESTSQLSERFVGLAQNAKIQSQQVEKVLELTQSLRIGEQTITLDEFTGLFSKTLNDSIDKVLQVSKRAITMVYMLDDAMKSLSAIEKFVDEVQKINKQANILALNSTIEARRSGEAGKGFGVIADEMRDISQKIRTLSLQMRSEISQVTQGMRNGYGVLQEVATTDMTSNIMAKEKLDMLLGSLIAQNQEFSSILSSSAQATNDIAKHISSMVMDMQFQDRTTQYIENSVRMLCYIVNTIDHLQKECNDIPKTMNDADPAIANEIASQFTLSEFSQLLRHKLTGAASAPIVIESLKAVDNTELF